MLESPQDVRTIVELLTDIRKAQGRQLSLMQDQHFWMIDFRYSISDLTGGLEALQEALPAASTPSQLAGFRTDVSEFKLDVIALGKDLGEMHCRMAEIESHMAEMKLALDTILSHIGAAATR